MRVLAILVVLAMVLMFLGGWLYFRDSGNTSEIILDKEKVQQDTQEAVEKGKQVTEEAAEEMKELGRSIEEAVSDDETIPDQPASDIETPEKPAPVPDTSDSQ